MNREEALDVALGQIERQFGKGSVMRMSDRPQVAVGAISTGSLALDMSASTCTFPPNPARLAYSRRCGERMTGSGTCAWWSGSTQPYRTLPSEPTSSWDFRARRRMTSPS